jgi:protein-tyrosine phosphatase
VFLTWPRWNLYGLVNQVVGLLSSDVPRTVYVHCSLGADRTGAVVACYMMKARGMTLSEALSFTSSQTPAGSPNRDYIALITAYAAAIGRR